MVVFLPSVWISCRHCIPHPVVSVHWFWIHRIKVNVVQRTYCPHFPELFNRDSFTFLDRADELDFRWRFGEPSKTRLDYFLTTR